MNKIKNKKCKACQELFTPFSSLSKACSPVCALKIVDDANKKKEKRQLKIRKDLLKTRVDWLREAQAIFNKFIRLRDEKEPCISCGRHHVGQYHAGHYRTIGSSPELRFNELNVHKQCSACNNHKSGNIVEYRLNLINKIGSKALDELEGPHEPLKLSIDDIKELKKEYARKYKELERL